MTVSADLRNAVARALAGISEDWSVAFKPSDAVTAPGFMVTWGPDLWRAPMTTAAYDTAQLEVYVLAGRADAGTADDALEAMVDAAVAALLPAGYRHQGVTVPGPLTVGGVPYLTARIRLTAPLPVIPET